MLTSILEGRERNLSTLTLVEKTPSKHPPPTTTTPSLLQSLPPPTAGSFNGEKVGKGVYWGEVVG